MRHLLNSLSYMLVFIASNFNVPSNFVNNDLVRRDLKAHIDRLIGG